eukprot:GHVU01093979.1.p1 GENE.GHVU01093979.1~~GHVU01093979.1.p1  ORF type:complete len:223 (+),score=23.98 GHVU01093979.1:5147-5815(+)
MHVRMYARICFIASHVSVPSTLLFSEASTEYVIRIAALTSTQILSFHGPAADALCEILEMLQQLFTKESVTAAIEGVKEDVVKVIQEAIVVWLTELQQGLLGLATKHSCQKKPRIEPQQHWIEEAWKEYQQQLTKASKKFHIISGAKDKWHPTYLRFDKGTAPSHVQVCVRLTPNWPLPNRQDEEYPLVATVAFAILVDQLERGEEAQVAQKCVLHVLQVVS